MLGFKYMKAPPTEYVIQYRKGQRTREGAGLAFWYYAPSTVLVKVPMATNEVNFMFKEFSADFQEVNIQGRMTWRVADANALAERMNFTVSGNADRYVSEDPEKLEDRLLNLAQVAVQAVLRKGQLRELLAATEPLRIAVKTNLQNNDMLQSLGIEVIDVALQAVRPTPETSRALEAEVRERILKEADDALYQRRKFALEQERQVKETELNTQVVLEKKQQQITETQLDGEQAEQKRRQELNRREQAAELQLVAEKRTSDIAELQARQAAEIQLNAEQMTSDLSLSEDQQTIAALALKQAREQAELDVFKTQAMLKAYAEVDPKVLMAMNAKELPPLQWLAFAIEGMASNGGLNFGEINLAPDTLKQFADTFTRSFAGASGVERKNVVRQSNAN